jgi:uncharacterized membrane protein YidH (DUF202 family)
MTTVELVTSGGVLAAFIIGAWSTWDVWQLHRDTAPRMTPLERMVLGLLVLICAVITLAAGYFGFLSVRRLFGFDAFDWSPLASAVVALAVLLLPARIRYVARRITRG